VTELAERWGVMRKYVYAHVHNRDLPAVRLGDKSIRIRLADIEAYEAAHMIAPVDPDLSPEDLEWIRELVRKSGPLTEERKTVIRSVFRA
jgi:excisionase family DNA binding protein